MIEHYYLRDTVKYFKPHKSFQSAQGVLCYSYFNDVVDVQVLNLNEKKDCQLPQFYEKIKPLLTIKDGVVILEYYEIDFLNGQDPENNVNFVKQELKMIVNKQYVKSQDMKGK